MLHEKCSKKCIKEKKCSQIFGNIISRFFEIFETLSDMGLITDQEKDMSFFLDETGEQAAQQ